MTKRVGVVIVTYNRVELLKITLCKVKAQQGLSTSDILVVNNASTDGTSDFLKTDTDGINVLEMSENEGPAGGFYEGISFFMQSGEYDYIWLMDDDFFPMTGCLQELLSHASEKKILYPKVRDKTLKTIKFPGWYAVLIPVPVIQKVGLPIKELFFWIEDTEYLQNRISQQNKIQIEWIESAKGVHFTKRNNRREAWRYYYEIRNTIYYRMYIQKGFVFRRMKKTTITWVKFFITICSHEKQKARKMKMFLLGSFHGITKKLGKIK